jgi:DNA recombination protein RmuC
MDNLAKHISMANKDVEEVSTSARKISSRFEKIEQVELENTPPVTLNVDDQEKMS